MGDHEGTVLQQVASLCAEIKQAFGHYIGMSQARYQLLVLLAHHGETSHALLQRRLGLDGATITRLVKQFEAEGLTSRRLDPADNRYTLVALTAAGQQTVAGISEAHAVFQGQLLAGIHEDDQQRMIEIVKHLRANIRGLQHQEDV
jgi:DNA-binding MarR family transcriptional regulator